LNVAIGATIIVVAEFVAVVGASRTVLVEAMVDEP
jgi:hypothetical protein